MKKISKNLLLGFLMLVLLTGLGSASLAERDYTSWSEDLIEVRNNKEWTIQFNQLVDLDTAYDNIYVVKESTGERVGIKLEQALHGKGIRVSPVGLYEDSQIYTLYIRDGLKNFLSKNLKDNIRLDFIILEKQEDQLELIDLSAPTRDTILLKFNMPIEEESAYSAIYRITINGYEFGKPGNITVHQMKHSDGSCSGLTIQRDTWDEEGFGYFEFLLDKKHYLKPGDEIQVKLFEGNIVSEDGKSYIDEYTSDIIIY